MKKLLVVGQTPPPYGGQSIMIDKMLKYNYQQVKMYHVRMAFSGDMDEIGKFKVGKVFHLFKVILQIYFYRIRYNISTLYYPPAGPDFVPILRDIIILLSTRWLFSRIVFHFHAGGVSETYPKLNPILRLLFRLAYYKVSAGISSSELNPPDGKKLKCKNNRIIPLGIEDNYQKYPSPSKTQKDTPINILFVGKVCESKGVEVLIDTANHLQQTETDFIFHIMGRFESPEFKQKIENKIKDYQIEKYISFLGVLTGESKDQAFLEADIFCFPTYFESETFGVVLLEAMQFSLPLVSTQWRGIPSIVKEGHNGFLVPIKAPEMVASKLKVLIQDKDLRQKMGAAGRQIYLEHYTIKRYCDQLEELFVNL